MNISSKYTIEHVTISVKEKIKVNTPLTIAQEYATYNASFEGSTSDGSAMMVILAIMVPVLIVSIVGLWKVYTKAGKPGWAAIVPFYNLYVLLQIVGRPVWWLLVLLVGFIPFVGAVVAFIVGVIITYDLSRSFGRGIGMTLLQIFLPFIAYPMLGFGSAKYSGPAAAGGASTSGGTLPPSQPSSPTTPPTPQA